MIDGMMKIFKMSCKDVYPLISESRDHSLPFLSRMRLKMHLAICGLCEIYQKQLETLCRIARSLGKDESKALEKTSLKPEIKEKFKNGSKKNFKWASNNLKIYKFAIRHP